VKPLAGASRRRTALLIAGPLALADHRHLRTLIETLE
jgi:hypothetical protein